MKPGPFYLFSLLSSAFLVYFSFRFLLDDSPREQLLQEEFSTGFISISNESNTPVDVRREFFPSKDVIIRSVYFDGRPRYNYHNASVFLVLIWREITDKKLVTGCQVGDTRTNNFTLRLIGETKMWRIYPKYNVIDHEEVLVHCHNVPSKNGSVAYLYYKLSKNSTERRVESERPIYFPPPRANPVSDVAVRYNLTVLTCTKVFGNPPWLKEWLEYQRFIGVDHVHITGDESFFRGIDKELSYHLEKLIAEGFLSVNFWILWLKNGKEVWYHNQGLILEDCVYQFRGTYDYVFILDTDDFFVPREPGEPHAQHYIKKYCWEDNKGTCKFRWIEYFPDHFGLDPKVPLVHGNVTSRLTNYTHTKQGNRKSVHRTQAIVDTATHYAFEILSKYSRVEVPVNTAYVAHMRKGKKPDPKSVKGLP
jgi:hypothetical protein